MSSGAPRPRVLWVDHVHRILGGAEVNLLELLAEPESRVAWESVVACDPAGRLHERLEALGIERRPYSLASSLGGLRLVGSRFPLTGAIRSLRALRDARRRIGALVHDLRPAVVVSCTNKDHFAAWPACRAAGVPSVWWVNDILSRDFFPWAARRAFHAQARRGASRLIVVSEFARRALVDHGLPDSLVRTIHNGIPLERYRPHGRGALRGMLNLGDATPLAGVLGRFTPWKGQDLLLEIAEKSARAGAPTHFVLIGHAFNEDQPYEDRLRAHVAGRGLKDRVHFVPFQPDVAVALSDLDVLLHTSRKPEPFGRVIIESMATGVPVIAARDGGVPEIIQHGENGLLASPGNADEYLALLNRLLADRALHARLAAAGRATVTARFSADRVRADFERLIAAVSAAP